MKKDITDKVHHTVANGDPKTSREIRDDLSLGPEDTDLLDRTLQRLKKEGKIRVMDRRRWASGDVHVCSGCEGRGWVRDQ